MELEPVRRYIEEFFDLPADIRHLPSDIEVLAEALSYALEMPELIQPFKRSLEELARYPSLEGIAFVIDAWQEDANLNLPPHFAISCHFYLDLDISEFSNRNSLLAGRPIPSDYFDEIDETISEKTNNPQTFYHFFSFTKGVNFETAVKDLIKSTFEKDPGPWGVNRVEEEPPSGFILAIVDKQPI